MALNNDYVTVVKILVEWLPGGGKLELHEIGRTSQAHLPIFTCEAAIVGGTVNFPIKGLGRARTLNYAKQEAARDFVYRLLLNPQIYLDILANDTSYCPIKSRPTPEEYGMVETPLENVDEDHLRKLKTDMNQDEPCGELPKGSLKTGQETVKDSI